MHWKWVVAALSCNRLFTYNLYAVFCVQFSFRLYFATETEHALSSWNICIVLWPQRGTNIAHSMEQTTNQNISCIQASAPKSKNKLIRYNFIFHQNNNIFCNDEQLLCFLLYTAISFVPENHAIQRTHSEYLVCHLFCLWEPYLCVIFAKNMLIACFT